MQINMMAVIVGTIVAFVGGAIWYGPLFGKKWMQITGFNPENEEARKRMQKQAMPLYVVQLVITIVQVYVLAYVIGLKDVSAVMTAVCMYIGFVLPSLIGAVMWSGKPKKVIMLQIWIQGGYQLLSFIILGAIIGMWK